MRSLRFSRIVLICAVTFSFGCIGQATPRPIEAPPKNFKECVERGGNILKSYPPQCVTADGTRFMQDEGAASSKAARGCKDLCGNGKCEEIVCMAIGCPCSESHESCPQDCKE